MNAKSKQEALNKLMGLCIKLNSPDFHLFFNYSGHVDMLEILIYCGGWDHKNKPDLKHNLWDYRTTEIKEIEKIINEIEWLHENYYATYKVVA